MQRLSGLFKSHGYLLNVKSNVLKTAWGKDENEENMATNMTVQWRERRKSFGNTGISNIYH